MPAIRRFRRALLVLALATASVAQAQTTDFSRLVARLSEPGGYFDSDNLVSNETSYLHVMGALRGLGVRGGAYLGVGPEQSFSYIAEIRPDIAILIDIRRDNLLLHLLFKAMFETAADRLGYLGLLFGRPVPADTAAWRTRDLPALLATVDATPPDTALHRRQHAMLMRLVASYGVPLGDTDRATLRRFHDEFATAGLGLTYTSAGRIARRNYPTVRRLYLETDLDGATASYLASDARWRTVRDLQRAGRIVPVTGDLAGPVAMRAIAAYLRETGRTVSAFYTSNVEMYLFRDGTFADFAANVRLLPAGPSSVIIRSWFNRGGGAAAGSVPGHFSTQLLQMLPRFVALTSQPGLVTYQMVIDDAVELRPAAARP